MSTSLKSSRNTIVHATELGAEKNGRRICPINDDLAWAHTWATPCFDTPGKTTLCTRRSHRHDA
jgi:hypothetical protein